MCNLNVLVKRKNGNNVTAFLQSVTSTSFASNSDGDGVALGNRIYKKLSKLNLFKYDEQIKAEDYVITHQRITTSGFSKKYTQPFKSPEFVLAHNGVMRIFEEKKHSDTYVFFQKFQEKFAKMKGTREERIVKSVKKLLDGKSGSYSIVIKDMVDNCMYYFKDDYTSVSVFMNKSYLYLTTKGGNEDFISLLGEHLREMDVEDYTIYRISTDKELSMVSLDTIKEPEYTSKYSYKSSKSDKSDKTKIKENNLEDFKTDEEKEFLDDMADSQAKSWGFSELHESKIEGKCAMCYKKCNTMNRDSGERICKECYREEIYDFMRYNESYMPLRAY